MSKYLNICNYFNGNIIIDKPESFLLCDSCASHHRVIYSGLTAAGLKCIQLKSKKFKFLCTDCECGVAKLTSSKSLIRDLKS